MKRKTIQSNSNQELQFIPSGCKLLDCVLTGGKGGWPLGRVSNIVGDKSTGKTLLAIEACANFAITFEQGLIRYREVESAFDSDYAESVGLPVSRVDFGEDYFVDTVEAFFNDLTNFCEQVEEAGTEGLYILDSLDALTDDAEKKRDIGEGTYGATKPKQMSQVFRRIIQRLKSTKIHLLVISQVRDNIGVTFGKSQTRSGGKALDFYASLVVWLGNIGRIEKTRKGVKRVVGVKIRAKCEKNKVGMPFRSCDFPLYFGYGIDDVAAGLAWLIEVGMVSSIEETKTSAEKLLKGLDKLADPDYEELRRDIELALPNCWEEVEQRFRPRRKKYG